MDSRAGGRSLSACNAVLSRPSVGRPPQTRLTPNGARDAIKAHAHAAGLEGVSGHLTYALAPPKT